MWVGDAAVLCTEVALNRTKTVQGLSAKVLLL